MSPLTPFPTLAILGDFGLTELLVIALAAVMIFGRRLPQVAARGFAQFQRFRRTLTQMWRETGIEDEMRRIQRDLDRSLPGKFDPASFARRETREIERRLKGDAHSQPRGPARVAPLPAPARSAEPREEPPVQEPAVASTPEAPPAAPPEGKAEEPLSERSRSPE